MNITAVAQRIGITVGMGTLLV